MQQPNIMGSNQIQDNKKFKPLQIIKHM
jgi:hypothetical protein